jgi:calcium-dependent protein kinase
MLDPDPSTRLTARQVLGKPSIVLASGECRECAALMLMDGMHAEHPWLKNADTAPNVSLGEAVRARLQQFSAMNKFKKKALGVVARNLPVEELDKYVQMFHIMDKDHNGNLTLEELMEGLHINGQPVPESEIRMLLEAVSALLGCSVACLLPSSIVGPDDDMHAYPCRPTRTATARWTATSS